MNKKCAGIVVVLLVIIGFGIFKFIFQGATRSAADGRTSIVLNAAERDLVFVEMRAFLSAVQQIITASTVNDMQKVASAARKVGAVVQDDIPGTLMGKLPLEFKKLGFDTHAKFDQMALDAESIADSRHTLEQLAELMQNCVGCHEAYRLDVQSK